MESVDGKFLFYAKNALSGRIWRVPVQGGEELPVAEGVASLRLPQNFSVGERGIIFAASANPAIGFEIRIFEFSTGKTRTVSHVSGALGNGMALSPDGRTLLFTTLEPGTGDLAMSEMRF